MSFEFDISQFIMPNCSKLNSKKVQEYSNKTEHVLVITIFENM